MPESSKLSPMLGRWNRRLKGMPVETGRLSYIDNDAQYPDTNYDKIYVSGLIRLLELQESCREHLSSVKTPLLIIQAEDDPVVAVSSATEIIEKVASESKSLEYLPWQQHVIIRDKGSAQTFHLIDHFLAKL